MQPERQHDPVLVHDVVAFLDPEPGAIVVDATFGAGGYSAALLDAGACTVIAIDRDPTVVPFAAELAERYADRFRFLPGRFSDMPALLAAEGIGAVQAIVFDLGVSSMQLDRAERGFSFQKNGPLDMRMGTNGPTAADLVNTADEQELADIIFDNGEERRARRIARAIVQARKSAPITDTAHLAAIVAGVVPHDGRIHPATRTFQALRIHINEERQELEAGLIAAEVLLTENGRLAVVTFHSLEDRLVKRFLQRRSGRTPQRSRHQPALPPSAAPSFRIGKSVTASKAEVAANPRARSARLRTAIRTAAPVWSTETRP